MYIGGGARAGIEIAWQAREQIAALRRLRIGEPRDHRLERLRDVAGMCDSVPCGTAARAGEERETTDGQRYQRRTSGRSNAKCAAGDHLTETSARFRIQSGDSRRLLEVQKKLVSLAARLLGRFISRDGTHHHGELST